jgi:hypothetical protein
MSLTYYIPGQHGAIIDAAQARQYGLGHAIIPDGPISALQTQCGPDSGVGLFMAVGDASPNPAAVGWKKHPDAGWWVGGAATEAELRRKNADGTGVRLRDGAIWLIPRIHAVLPDRPTCVPQIYAMGAGGKWTGEPDPAYRAICELAFRFWSYWRQAGAEENAAITMQEALDLAAGSLAINYRLSAFEVGHMGLLGTPEVRECLMAVIDAAEILARVKKNLTPAPATPVSQPGGLAPAPLP